MKNKATRICLVVLVVYLLLGVVFYAIAGDSLHYTTDTTPSVTNKAVFGEFTAGQVIRQSFSCKYDTLNSVGLLVGTMARKNTDTILAEILDENGTILYSKILNTSAMKDNSVYTMEISPAINDAKGQSFILQMTSQNGINGNAVSFYYGNTVETGRFSFDVEVPPMYLNDVPQTDEDDQPCCLCLTVTGTDYHWFGANYWWIYGAVALLLALYLLYLIHCHVKGKKSLMLGVVYSLNKYRFLIKQLVSRDFKTKYKRSVLGMLWSFLNPLLTMSIQFVVFSTLFKSDINNFVIYLLSGIICFNFFNEASNMCLMSIIGNASLINKVYVPKYIYPFSRTLSSGINLLLSLVPLLMMLLVTRTPITSAILLLPFALLMLFLLSYGMGLILATMMVFFRDTQFLWGICSMLLMYLTPVFYPETIIPTKFLTVYRMNPLYQVISFIRSILIDGVSPEPISYLYCIILCGIPFLIGLAIFRKNQEKFVLNI